MSALKKRADTSKQNEKPTLNKYISRFLEKFRNLFLFKI
jgi:hypothetical protein